MSPDLSCLRHCGYVRQNVSPHVTFCCPPYPRGVCCQKPGDPEWQGNQEPTRVALQLASRLCSTELGMPASSEGQDSCVIPGLVPLWPPSWALGFTLARAALLSSSTALAFYL